MVAAARRSTSGELDALDDLAVALVETARTPTRVAARSAGPGVRHTPTGAQMDVLLFVTHHPGQTVSELAERLQLARNTISTLVGQLSRAALIERTGNPADARVARLSLTAAAAAQTAGWRSRRAAAVRDALTCLEGPDRAAVEAALGPLSALIAAVESAGPLGLSVAGADPGLTPGGRVQAHESSTSR